MNKNSRQRESYAVEHGLDKMAEQAAAAVERHVCCGEVKPDHHPMCRSYVPPSVPEHIDGQERLL